MYAGGRFLEATDGRIHLSPGDWVNLNNEFGYVPLEGTKFYQQREENNDAAFFKLAIDHGERPQSRSGAKYAYALLPETGMEETIEFYEDPTVEILELSESMHAVLDKETGIVGINAFEAGKSLVGITFLTPCSVMIDKDVFYITDPTQTKSCVSLEFDKDIEAFGDDNITQEGRVVTVNLPIKGKSYSFTAKGY